MLFLLLVLVFILICWSIARSQTFIHILLDMPEQESSILVQSEVSMIPRRSAESQRGEISDTNKVTPLINTLARYNLTTFYFYYYNTSRAMHIKVSFVRWVALQHCSIR